jgi:acyl-CoA synthetase (AMP-forming)/AMP-acid ligase II
MGCLVLAALGLIVGLFILIIPGNPESINLILGFLLIGVCAVPWVRLLIRKSQEEAAKQQQATRQAQVATLVQELQPPAPLPERQAPQEIEQSPPQSQQWRRSKLLDEDEPEIAPEKDTNTVHCARCGMEYPPGQVVCLRCGMTVFN